MKSGFFIMQLWQTGNIGSHNIKKFKDNPEEGHSTYEAAKLWMLKLQADDNWELTKGNYTFAIMELFWYY
jgi:hypothetical protein